MGLVSRVTTLEGIHCIGGGSKDSQTTELDKPYSECDNIVPSLDNLNGIRSQLPYHIILAV